MFETHPLEARCRCSRERIAGILRSLPRRGHRGDARGAGDDRDLRVLQHDVPVHGRRSGAARFVTAAGEIPCQQGISRFCGRARPEKAADSAGVRAKFPRSEQGNFRARAGDAQRAIREFAPRSRSCCRAVRRRVHHRRRMPLECGDFIARIQACEPRLSRTCGGRKRVTPQGGNHGGPATAAMAFRRQCACYAALRCSTQGGCADRFHSQPRRICSRSHQEPGENRWPMRKSRPCGKNWRRGRGRRIIGSGGSISMRAGASTGCRPMSRSSRSAPAGCAPNGFRRRGRPTTPRSFICMAAGM